MTPFYHRCLALALLLASISLSKAASLSDLTFEVNDDHVIITDCDIFASGPLVIPTNIEGLPVTTIGANAFRSCSSLTSISLPSGIESIGSEAFWGTTISSLTIPATVFDLQTSALAGTRQITALTVSPSNPFFETLNGIIYSEDFSTLVSYPVAKNDATFTVPESVTAISGGAFEGNLGLLQINLSSGLLSIGPRAFAFTRMANISLPDTLTSIGPEAFLLCRSLESITFGPNLISLGASAFEDCDLLTSVQIPDSVIAIGESAFQNCNLLETISIGSGLLEILPFFAAQCQLLEAVNITAPFTSIGESAFASCTELQSFSFPSSVTSLGPDAFSRCTSLTSITLPENLTTIPDHCFSNCSNITSISLPSNLEEIGISTFAQCNSIRDLLLPDSLQSIDQGAFIDCSQIEDLVVPSSVQSIANLAFHGTGIRTLELSETPIQLGDSAFSSCGSLTSLNLGTGITTIPESCFANCRNLRAVTLPDQITSVGEFAFSQCNLLSSLTIGDSLAQINPTSFYKCARLQNISVFPENPNLTAFENALYSPDMTILFMIPAGYASSQFTVPSTVTELGSHAFLSGLNLNRIILPAQLSTIGDYAFSECQNLSSLELPPLVTRIGKFAFHRCHSLTEINVPADISLLEEGSFSQLINLESIYFQGHIPTLDLEVFEDSAPDFQVIIHPTSEGFESTFEGRLVTTANLPTFPTPIITDFTITDSNLQISIRVTDPPTPLNLYSSSDLKTWTRVNNATFTSGNILVPSDLSAQSRFFRVRISSD